MIQTYQVICGDSSVVVIRAFYIFKLRVELDDNLLEDEGPDLSAHVGVEDSDHHAVLHDEAGGDHRGLVNQRAKQQI